MLHLNKAHFQELQLQGKVAREGVTLLIGAPGEDSSGSKSSCI